MWLIIMSSLLLCLWIPPSCAFTVSSFSHPGRKGLKKEQKRFLKMTAQPEDIEEEESSICGDGELDTPSPYIVLKDLSWRVEKLRLEEANKRRFLKAGPRFLPYDECRKWVAAWSRWDSEQDWREWIDMGEKRNSYIPARPDEYYGRLGQWISWEHFLGLEEKKDSDEFS